MKNMKDAILHACCTDAKEGKLASLRGVTLPLDTVSLQAAFRPGVRRVICARRWEARNSSRWVKILLHRSYMMEKVSTAHCSSGDFLIKGPGRQGADIDQSAADLTMKKFAALRN
jgi:hypothetical protein